MFKGSDVDGDVMRVSQDPDVEQWWIDQGMEWSEGLSIRMVPVPFIGPLLPDLCSMCGEPIVSDGFTSWSHLWPWPSTSELGHTAVRDPF
jgi:hypothetical protein